MLALLTEQRRKKTVEHLQGVHQDIDAITAAAEELSRRVINLAPLLAQQLAKGEHAAAQQTAGQIFMLSRMIEQHAIVCLERWRAAISAAHSTIIETKRGTYRQRLRRR